MAHLDSITSRLSSNEPSGSDRSPTSSTTSPGSEVEVQPRGWRRRDRRLRRLNTELLEAVEALHSEEIERLLKSGASPNATCRLGLVTACHIAAVLAGDSLSILVKYGAEKHRVDVLGRSPLHLAAWAGNVKQIAILLDFPEDLQNTVENMTTETEEKIRQLSDNIRELTNIRCETQKAKLEIPKIWKDTIDHDCKNIFGGSLPEFEHGWTPLHAAASCVRASCIKLLLLAGADPNIPDMQGCMPLDVVACAYYKNQEFDRQHITDVIILLLGAGGGFNTMTLNGLNNMDTPLHTAVELEDMEAVKELLRAGTSMKVLNKAGLTPLHVCVIKELEDILQVLANYEHAIDGTLLPVVDVKDREGHTVLQAAIEAAWVPGVCVALEAGADVTMKANDGETPIHSAAALGNIDVLNEILSVAKEKDALDYQNFAGETALFKAIINRRIECVSQILKKGASLNIMLPGDVSVFHLAADYGYDVILKEILEYNKIVTETMINALTAQSHSGFAAIHFAVYSNHKKCVEVLLSNKADIQCRTTSIPCKSRTPLHLAALKNYVEIANMILTFDKTTLYATDSIGWYPLHTACYHGSRKVITLFLKEGADLSSSTKTHFKYKRTAIDMIMNSLPNSTQFMEDVFDSYITCNDKDLSDPNCKIAIDYGILLPGESEMRQMKVIAAMVKTGNRHGQRKLLVHPLVESFLYLKWKALLPFFHTIMILYSLFVLSLTIFIVSVFYSKDLNVKPPHWLNFKMWSYFIYLTIFLIFVQELLYMNVKRNRYFVRLETWVKFGSLALAVILPQSILHAEPDDQWPRHVATLTLLLSWLEMMFLLSRFPDWGYYVLMFGKVLSNVIKILLTFVFLVIGFSMSFMIQFRSQVPFEDPWASFVKTVVMLTAEFDYEALFGEAHSEKLNTSISIVRTIFLLFVILAVMVLMNLLIGVAVSDINNLEVLGHIDRLAIQVEYLGTLDSLVYNKIFSFMLPKTLNSTLKDRKKVTRVMVLYPGKPLYKTTKSIPKRIKDDIYNNAQKKKKQMEDNIGMQHIRTMMTEIHEALIINKNKLKKPQQRMSRLTDGTCIHDIVKPNETVYDLRDKTQMYIEKCTDAMDSLNVKVDQINVEINVIKQCLTRLDNFKNKQENENETSIDSSNYNDRLDKATTSQAIYDNIKGTVDRLRDKFRKRDDNRNDTASESSSAYLNKNDDVKNKGPTDKGNKMNDKN